LHGIGAPIPLNGVVGSRRKCREQYERECFHHVGLAVLLRWFLLADGK
jgi:hypothetical protein